MSVRIKGEPNVLLLDFIELNKLQSILIKSANNIVRNFIREYGIALRVVNAKVTDPQNKYSTGFKPTFETGTLNITVERGDAILRGAGGLIYGVSNSNPKTIIAPNENGVYKLLLRYAGSSVEDGTITMTHGSKNVVGQGTKFSEIFAAGRSIIPLTLNGIPVADIYEVETVTDDTFLTLKEVYAGTTLSANLFGVGGSYVNIPSAPLDNLIYFYDAFEIVLTNSAKGEFDYWLAEVTVVGGVITGLVDKREANILRLWGTDTDTLKLSYSKSYVQIANTVDQAPTEETFETNVGKLATNDLGNSFPLFDKLNDTPPAIKITATFQDRLIYVSSHPTVILPNGNIQFKVKPSSQGADTTELYFSFELQPYQSESPAYSTTPSTGQISMYLKSDVVVIDTAIDEATAESLETNSGKLNVDENGLPFPIFGEIPIIVPVKSQGFDIQIVRGSIELINGNVRFKAFIGSVGDAPTDGIYKATFLFILY